MALRRCLGSHLSTTGSPSLGGGVPGLTCSAAAFFFFARPSPLPWLRRTRFGGWPWPDVGVVHAREEQRFALFPDGTKETRPRRETK